MPEERIDILLVVIKRTNKYLDTNIHFSTVLKAAVPSSPPPANAQLHTELL